MPAQGMQSSGGAGGIWLLAIGYWLFVRDEVFVCLDMKFSIADCRIQITDPTIRYPQFAIRNSLKYLSPLLLLLVSIITSRAEQIVEGYAVLRGKDYAFQLKAPRNWVLDNESGRDQGLNVVFYPKNSSWASSSAICYARVRSLDDTVKTIEDQVKDTLKVFREDGSVGVQAKYVKTLTTRDASKAKIYYFSEDKYGNYEATAYFQGKESIHFVSLSCPNRQIFEYSLAAFDALVTSYEDLTKPSTTDANPSPWRN
jgi:hypothetical protein